MKRELEPGKAAVFQQPGARGIPQRQGVPGVNLLEVQTTESSLSPA